MNARFGYDELRSIHVLFNFSDFTNILGSLWKQIAYLATGKKIQHSKI